jgi:hypothetical protein
MMQCASTVRKDVKYMLSFYLSSVGYDCFHVGLIASTLSLIFSLSLDIASQINYRACFKKKTIELVPGV